jgi:prepilin-type N-terminal cleavage/methylation domain-containing protein
MLTMEKGFTFIEVVVALVVLSFGVLGTATAGARLAFTAVDIERRTVALQVIEDRLAEVRTHPDYASLDSVFSSQQDTVPGVPGMLRSTAITRTQNPGSAGRTIDYTTITVAAFGSSLSKPLARTIILAIP